MGDPPGVRSAGARGGSAYAYADQKSEVRAHKGQASGGVITVFAATATAIKVIQNGVIPRRNRKHPTLDSAEGYSAGDGRASTFLHLKGW
jgi:hypothetical protein